MHDTLAGYVRTMASVVHFHRGMEVEPKSRLFAWNIRHAAFLVGRHHVRREGTTAFHALHSRDARDKLVQFAEMVLFRLDGDKRRKSLRAGASGSGLASTR